MNKLKDIIKAEMDTITTDKDIAASAKRRAESTVKHSHRYGTVIAAICAAAVMCTTVVSAVKFGWLNDLLGTASYSEDAFAQVDVSMKDVHLNKGENAPSDMDFRLLDAVSDGQSLIINYELSGTFDEEITEQLFYHSAKINDDTTRFGYSTKISIISDGTHCMIISTSLGINAGDNIILAFSGSDSHTEIGSADMTVNEDVPKLTKEIQVGSPAVLRDRSKPYTAEKDIIIESLSISALTVRVNYLSKDNSNNFIFGADTSIVMTDGQTISPDSVSSYSTKVPAQNDAGYYSQHFDILCLDVIDPDNISAVVIGDLTIPVK